MTDFAIDFELIIHLCTLHTKNKKSVVIIKFKQNCIVFFDCESLS